MMTRADKLHTALITYTYSIAPMDIYDWGNRGLIGTYDIVYPPDSIRNVIIWYMQVVVPHNKVQFKPISSNVVPSMTRYPLYISHYVR